MSGAENANAVQSHDGSGAYDEAEQAGKRAHTWVTARGDLVAALHRTRVTLAGTASGHSEGRDVRDERSVKHNCEDSMEAVIVWSCVLDWGTAEQTASPFIRFPGFLVDQW